MTNDKKLEIAEGCYYFDATGKIRGPMKRHANGKWYERASIDYWDDNGEVLSPSPRGLSKLVGEAIVAAMPTPWLPVIKIDSDRKGYMLELFADYKSVEIDGDDEQIYVITESNVIRLFERLGVFKPGAKPADVKEFVSRNTDEAVALAELAAGKIGSLLGPRSREDALVEITNDFRRSVESTVHRVEARCSKLERDEQAVIDGPIVAPEKLKPLAIKPPGLKGAVSYIDGGMVGTERVLPEQISIPKVRLFFPDMDKHGPSSMDSKRQADGQYKTTGNLKDQALKEAIAGVQREYAKLLAKKIVDRLFKALLIHGFENDKDVGDLLKNHEFLAKSLVEKVILNIEPEKVENAPDS